MPAMRPRAQDPLLHHETAAQPVDSDPEEGGQTRDFPGRHELDRGPESTRRGQSQKCPGPELSRRVHRRASLPLSERHLLGLQVLCARARPRGDKAGGCTLEGGDSV